MIEITLIVKDELRKLSSTKFVSDIDIRQSNNPISELIEYRINQVREEVMLEINKRRDIDR